MRKIDQTVGKIRLLLSEVSQREQSCRALRDQFAAQRRRVLQAGLYGEVDLGTILGLLDDLDRKSEETVRSERLLGLIRQRAEAELRSLTVTREVEDAKSDLVAIAARGDAIRQELGAIDGAAEPDRAEALRAEQARLAAEADRLRARIAEMSELAAQQFSAGRLPEAGAG